LNSAQWVCGHAIKTRRIISIFLGFLGTRVISLHSHLGSLLQLGLTLHPSLQEVQLTLLLFDFFLDFVKFPLCCCAFGGNVEIVAAAAEHGEL
jgi:hypothetical protein